MTFCILGMVRMSEKLILRLLILLNKYIVFELFFLPILLSVLLIAFRLIESGEFSCVEKLRFWFVEMNASMFLTIMVPVLAI